MCEKNDLQLSLNGDTFQALKTDFDSILARTVGNMTMRGADEATVTLKLTISLEKAYSGSYDDAKELTKPSFKHDISSVMQVKDKKTGSLAGDYELVWDEDEKKYVMRKLGGEQVSMFDDEATPNTYDGEYEEKSGVVLCLEATNGDTENDDEETSRLKWLSMFVGRNLKIVETNGTLTVRTDKNEIVLTSADGVFHVDAEILEEHKGHDIKCIGFYDEDTETEGGRILSVEFRCDDCYETIFEFPNFNESDGDIESDCCEEDDPEFDDETMGYDDPEMD